MFNRIGTAAENFRCCLVVQIKRILRRTIHPGDSSCHLSTCGQPLLLPALVRRFVFT